LIGCIFTIECCTISWKATLQYTIALSTIKARYIVIAKAIKEAIWSRDLFEDLNVDYGVTIVHCDSQNVIHLTKDQIYHERTKHIDVWYYYIQDILFDG